MNQRLLSEESRAEFLRLASASCEGKLTPDEQSRLDELLRDHEEAREIWLDFSRMHVELRLHTRAGVVTKRLQQQLATGDTLDSGKCDVVEREGVRRSSSKQQIVAPSPYVSSPSNIGKTSTYAKMALAAGLAAALILMISIANRHAPSVNHQPSQSPIAKKAREKASDNTAKRRPQVVALMSVLGDQPAASVDNQSEQSLLTGEEVVLDTGRARLAMTGGAKLILEAPVRLKLLSPDHVRLLEGSLSAQLSDWANKGFIVDTNAMRVVDLGTTFSVTAESATAAEARVLEGLIKVQPRESDERALKSFLLNEGESVRVEGKSTVRNNQKIEIADRKERLEEFAALNGYKHIPMRNTGIGLLEGEEDPYWKIAPSGSKSLTPRQQYAVVCQPHKRYSINEPNRSQWIAMNHTNDPVAPNTSFTFKTSFNLTGFEPNSVHVIGQTLADNGVKEIRINGMPVALDAWVDNTHMQEFRRNEFRVFEVSSGFHEGTNQIEIDVWNGGEFRYQTQASPKLEAVPNPMALRVEWQAFGRPLRGN